MTKHDSAHTFKYFPVTNVYQCQIPGCNFTKAAANNSNVHTFNIPAENLPALLRKLKALAKRSTKLGLDVDTLSWSTGETYSKEKRTEFGRPYRQHYTPVTLTVNGDVQLPGGWHLVGVLDHTSADYPIILGVPGEELPVKYRTAGPDCDHCKGKRRRNTTIIIRDEQPAAFADHYKQIGSTCIADYLGHKSALDIARGYQYLADFVDGLGDEEGLFYRRPKGAWEIDDCLTFVSACIRERGWAPRSGEGFATADEAWDWFLRDFQSYTIKTGGTRHSGGSSTTIHPPTINDADREIAKKAIAWLTEQDPVKAKSDYIFNIQAIAASPTVSKKTIGFAASIISSYQRSVERDLRYAAKRKAEKAANNGHVSEWVGEVKERLRSVAINVLGAYETEGDYGLSTRVVFKDEAGNDFVWFASGSVELEQGESYVADFTVKRHNEFKGSKQTQVNRLRVV